MHIQKEFRRENFRATKKFCATMRHGRFSNLSFTMATAQNNNRAFRSTLKVPPGSSISE
jgi:hypothetical protein